MNSVEQALAALSRVDPGAVGDARAAWEALTGGDGPESLTQWRLQQFCWDTVPRTWPGDAEARRRLVEALATLLDELGMERYGAIVRGETTRQVLAAAEHSAERARAVARRSMQRSGIEPPDTELLTWGAVMGMAEARALEAVADRLEMAVAAEDLQPGSRGWRDQQADLTIAVLTTPRPDFTHRAPYEAILDERLYEWVRGPRSTTRSGLLAPLEGRLR